METNTAFLNWNTYRYFPYERDLGEREAIALLNPEKLVVSNDNLQVLGRFNEMQLKRLVYFSGYTVKGKTISTLQKDLECSSITNGSHNRQSTRYSVHGLHEYKGKFNPQVVRGILNVLGVTPKSKIIDPFCGSGTSLVECAHGGMNAIGLDMNPLAVYISNAKLLALSTPQRVLMDIFTKLVDKSEKVVIKPSLRDIKHQDKRYEYLSRWFDKKTLIALESLKSYIHSFAEEYQGIFMVIASDLLRDYSLQEPKDLRIRRRYSPFPEQALWPAFKRKTQKFLDNLDSVQQVIGVKKYSSNAILCDSRSVDTSNFIGRPVAGFDAAITSPPYATALPYIDTQRLSLVWLELISPSDIGCLGARLTGSREFVQEQKMKSQDSFENNKNELPDSAYKYCIKLNKAIASYDGFRRRSVPLLLYRYLSDMQDIFRGMFNIMRPSAPFALIVGHNRTTLGGKLISIDTPSLLCSIAESCGWIHEDSIALQTYQRYDSHKANSVKAETLLIVKKP